MQEISLLQAHMTAFAAGFVLDLIIGDPYFLPHPVRWIGSLIAFLDKSLLGDASDTQPDPDKRDAASERSRGTLLVIIVLLLTLIVSAVCVALPYYLSVTFGVVIESVLTCYVLAMTSLRRESMKVYHRLAENDIEGARHAVSMIVGRDTAVLDEKGVTKAAVETVAENFSDGVIAPMLYTAIGGPVLGLLYKAINTMDSMVGYKNDRYMNFGTSAAKLDDAANWLPSRLSALLLIVACIVCGTDYDAGRAYRTWKRDRYNHKSPNAAQTESACAGALGVQLAGDAQYFGKIVKKPFIGDALRPIEYEDIIRTNRLMTAASVIAELICLTVMILVLISIK